MTRKREPRLGVGAIVIVHDPDFEQDTNGVVANYANPASATVLILDGKRAGISYVFPIEQLEPCGWVTKYSSAGWPEQDE